MILDAINNPEDLKSLSLAQLEKLCEELRIFLINSVLDSGGHFASGLGVIELTVALHYVFNTPEDAIIWDVGHQAYPHKILTGRKNKISTIRKKGGLKPFPCPQESPYDAFAVGHSSTSISAGLGMSIAAQLQHMQKQVVAVIGDGALTAGMAFEALNHAGDLKANLLVILNDNDMSISPNVGALGNMLTRTLSNPIMQNLRSEGARVIDRLPFPNALDIARKTEEHLKGIIAGGTLFEELDFKYFGPIDGHDLPTLIQTLKNLSTKSGPKLLHIITKKGKGYHKAESAPTTYHAVDSLRKKTSESSDQSFTQVFSQWLCDAAAKDSNLVAITPAMCEGSGLNLFRQQFPSRFLDAAIAEQHAVTLAAGMAISGLHPVVAIYSTFLQRAYDQLIHDVALQNLPVIFAVDRAGIVGPDGPTHCGAFDLAFLRIIPNLVIMAPSDANECYHMLNLAKACQKPAVVRYPKASASGVIQNGMNMVLGKANLIKRGDSLLIISIGAVRILAEEAGRIFNATVVDLRFIKPLDHELLCDLACQHEAIITIEDGIISGGAGSAIQEMLGQNHIYKPFKLFGLPDRFLNHGTREEILEEAGLTNLSIIEEIKAFIAQHSILAK